MSAPDDPAAPGGRGRQARGAVPVEDAVTLIIVRDRAGSRADAGAPSEGSDAPGVEVLLLERHPDSVFAPGALVFPGGKLDPTDDLPPDRVRLPGAHDWVSRLGVADDAAARAMLVAAVRETFEECGLLLAAHRDGSPVSSTVPTHEVAQVRAALATRGSTFDWRPWLAEHGLLLDLQALAMWSWWVTPVGPPRRYDTRFLVARVPADQLASHDRVETTSMRWITPDAALAAHAAGELHMIFPTRRTLEQLRRYPDADAVMDAARSGRVDLRRIQPEVVLVDGTPMVQHPDGGPPAAV